MVMMLPNHLCDIVIIYMFACVLHCACLYYSERAVERIN
jgi:hypothetical protein